MRIIISSQKSRDFRTNYNSIIIEDIGGRLGLYFNGKYKIIEQVFDRFYVGDYIAAYSTSNVLKAIKGNESVLLSLKTSNFNVADELIAFVDEPDKYFKAFYKDSIYELEDLLVGDLTLNYECGDNFVVYLSEKENQVKIFTEGEILYLMSISPGLKFDVGKDIAAFNIPSENRFSIFYKDEVFDLEFFPAKQFNCGDGFVLYVDHMNSLKCFFNGETYELFAYSPDKTLINDRSAVFEDGSIFYYMYSGRLLTIENFIPQNYILENNILLYQDNSGRYKYVVEGEKGYVEDKDIRMVEVQGELIVYTTGINNQYVIDPKKK
jgi:hypothetical protein